MMSAAECMANARDALACAVKETDPHLKIHWQQLAQEWSAQAASVEIHEILRRLLLDHDPD
jgi:hypothetical protein